MTTIVGYADGRGVWMSADTQTNVYDRPVSGARKILRLIVLDAGEEPAAVLLGIAGNAAMPALARKAWEGVERNLPDSEAGLQDWCDYVASVLTERMVEAGLVDPEEGQLDGNFLLGVPARGGRASTLWTIAHHMAIRMPDGRGAVGSGEGPATGALDASLSAGLKPDMAVLEACGIAIKRDRYSGFPIRSESLVLADEEDS